jgi:hypothetical protein
MRETGDKGKKGKGERKEKSGRRLPHVLPLIDSGTKNTKTRHSTGYNTLSAKKSCNRLSLPIHIYS